MRTITEIYNVYNYDELETKAQAQARENYMDSIRNDFTFYEYFTDICESELMSSYPNTCNDMYVQWDFSGCQGSGINIVGTIDLESILERHLSAFSELEELELKQVLKTCDELIAPRNERYTYSKINDIDFESWECEQWDVMGNVMDFENVPNFDLLRKFEKVVKEDLEDFTLLIQDLGYEYFFRSDEQLEEEIKENGLEFHKDGSIYEGGE